MQLEELQKHVQDLRAFLKSASAIADKLAVVFPEMEEPALRAQCSVIQAFLRQTERQEQILTRMVTAKNTGENMLVGF